MHLRCLRVGEWGTRIGPENESGDSPTAFSRRIGVEEQKLADRFDALLDSSRQARVTEFGELAFKTTIVLSRSSTGKSCSYSLRQTRFLRGGGKHAPGFMTLCRMSVAPSS